MALYYCHLLITLHKWEFVLVTDRSGILTFCPNRTSQLKFCLPNRTEQNQTNKKSLEPELEFVTRGVELLYYSCTDIPADQGS